MTIKNTSYSKAKQQQTAKDLPVGGTTSEHLGNVNKQLSEILKWSTIKENAPEDNNENHLHDVREALLFMWKYASKKESKEYMKIELFDTIYDLGNKINPELLRGLIALFRVVAIDPKKFSKSMSDYATSDDIAALMEFGGYVLEYWPENYEETQENAQSLYQEYNEIGG
jgi:hypothetical protein